ncbi:hypothetical protein [Hwanghaeella sp. LZ110]|uniref:hypothetical protein n=1 Tax=Hwanghaeella sp. LZ110 TaxID=3402810 RepID=UPI003B68510C
MKNFVIFVLSLIILVGGAAAAYPLYTNYVEDQIANWVTVENARHPDATFSYQTLEARPLTSEIIIHGLSFDTKDETTTIQRAEVTVDSFLLLTRVNSVKQAQFLNISSISKTETITTSAGIITLSNLTGNLTDFAFSTPDDIDIFNQVSADTLLMEAVTLKDTEEGIDIPIAQIQLSDIHNGMIGETALRDLSIAVDGATVTIGEILLNGLNAGETMKLTQRMEQDGRWEPSARDVIKALHLQRIEVSDLIATPDGQPQMGLGGFTISDIVYSDGIPTALTATYDNLNTPITDDIRRDLLNGVGSQIHVDLPDNVISKGSFSYALDTQQDRLSLSNSSYDSWLETQIDVEFDIRNVVSVFNALKEDQTPNENDTMRVEVGGMSIRAENKTPWEAPKILDGKPTLRLFLLNTLKSFNLSPKLDTAIGQPLQKFLRQGGVLEISTNPTRRLTLLEFMFMHSATPEQIVDSVGFSATHNPN